MAKITISVGDMVLVCFAPGILGFSLRFRGFCSTYFVFVSANVSEVLGTLAGCGSAVKENLQMDPFLDHLCSRKPDGLRKITRKSPEKI
jgi:hypothetical protein